MPYRVIPSVGTGSVVVVAIVVVLVLIVVVGRVDVVGAMVVTGIAEGAEVLVVGTSAVVLDCCGWVVVSLAALSETSGAHATMNTVNALHRTRQI